MGRILTPNEWMNCALNIEHELENGSPFSRHRQSSDRRILPREFPDKSLRPVWRSRKKWGRTHARMQRAGPADIGDGRESRCEPSFDRHGHVRLSRERLTK